MISQAGVFRWMAVLCEECPKTAPAFVEMCSAPQVRKFIDTASANTDEIQAFLKKHGEELRALIRSAK